MRQWTRAATALGGAALLAASTACGDTGDDQVGGASDLTEPVDAEAAADLAQIVSETRLRDMELNNAENRIIADCMEDNGHLVHDKWQLFEYDTENGGEASFGEQHYPFDEWLPELETAQATGFGAWAQAPESEGSAEAAEYYGWEEDEGDSEKLDNSEFDALSKEAKQSWYVDYAGEDWALAYHAYEYLSETEIQDLMESTGSEGGALDLGTPEPGGCMAEMIADLYGEPELVEVAADSEGGTGEEWQWRPEAPVNEYEFDWGELQPEWHDGLFEAESDFLDCLAERGQGDWQFTQWGEVPVRTYWDQIYFAGHFEEEDDGTNVEVPEPAADTPDDFEGKKTAEIAMAVDFAECADSSGYREAGRNAWDQLHYGVYAEVEVELYAWQEGVNDALAKAQELIAG